MFLQESSIFHARVLRSRHPRRYHLPSPCCVVRQTCAARSPLKLELVKSEAQRDATWEIRFRTASMPSEKRLWLIHERNLTICMVARVNEMRS
jgi:hypothetical protein